MRLHRPVEQLCPARPENCILYLSAVRLARGWRGEQSSYLLLSCRAPPAPPPTSTSIGGQARCSRRHLPPTPTPPPHAQSPAPQTTDAATTAQQAAPGGSSGVGRSKGEVYIGHEKEDYEGRRTGVKGRIIIDDPSKYPSRENDVTGEPAAGERAYEYDSVRGGRGWGQGSRGS